MPNSNIKEAIILVGGLGTRLKPIVQDLPKPMASVAGKPFLEYLLDLVSNLGIKKVILAAGYKNEILKNHFKDVYKDLEIDFSIETEALGTGGAIKNALKQVNEEKILILNGDSYCNIKAEELNSTDSFTLYAIPVEDTSRYGALEIENNSLRGFTEKGVSGNGFINSGIYTVDKSIFTENNDFPKNFSIEKDFIPKYLEDKEIKVKKLEEKSFIDIGTPEDFLKAQELFKQ